MNNKQNLEKAQAILELIEKANSLILNYDYKVKDMQEREIFDAAFWLSFYTERYETMKAVKARLKKYYNNTIDKLTKFNG